METRTFFDLSGQVAVVTGGGQSIGEGIARRLTAAGARVAILDVNEPNARSRRPWAGWESSATCRGPNNGESSQGEVDLMESWGSHPNEIAVHIHGTKGATPSATVPVDSLYDKFHLYALEWYPDHMDFFLDDRRILTYKKDPSLGWSFDHPMYLIMNIACGGPNEPPRTTPSFRR